MIEKGSEYGTGNDWIWGNGGEAAEVDASPETTEMSDVERDELASQIGRPVLAVVGGRRTHPGADRRRGRRSAASDCICCAAFGNLRRSIFRKSRENRSLPASPDRSSRRALRPPADDVGASSRVRAGNRAAIGAADNGRGLGRRHLDLGKVFIQHFASGGTLLNFNPPDYREFIKAQKEDGLFDPAAVSPPDAAQRSCRTVPIEQGPGNDGRLM